MPLDVLEIRRLAFLAANSTAPRKKAASKLLANASYKRARLAISATINPGMKRLVRFLELLRFFDDAPWANKTFEVNQMMIRRLTHSHLPVIIGEYVCADAPKASISCDFSSAVSR
jgi:hypothetical protein